MKTEVTDVSEESSSGSGADRSLGQKVKRTFENKVLVPLAATVVSAGVSYLMRKLPLILEERVLPKLKERGVSVPGPAKKVDEAASSLPETSSAKEELADQQAEREEQSVEAKVPSASDLSNDEREAERLKREERRRERKRALSSA